MKPLSRYERAAGELRERIAELETGNRDLRNQVEALTAERDAALSDKAADALVGALRWYQEHVRDCRKNTREGDNARHELDADGGRRAREALAASGAA